MDIDLQQLENDFVFVVATQHPREKAEIDIPVVKSLIKLYDENIGVITFYENKEGLSAINNQVIKAALNNRSKVQYFIFIHDDVEIRDFNILETLENSFKQFDVIGLAGTTKISFKSPMIAWHASPKECWRGGVAHPQQYKDKTVTYFNSYGIYDAQVLTIDGLFIAVKKEVFEAGVRFNESFNFDFYDMSFCLNAREKGFKVGVAPIFCLHHSHGAGIYDITYTEAQKKFIEEYKDKS
jgi:GT2 family glycosyltransferase